MSMLQVSRDDCTTAADVVARCRAVRERLKAQRVVRPVAEPVVEPAVLVAEEKQEPIDRRIVPPTVKSIIAVVCRHFGLSETQLLAQRRDASIVWPRHVAMYLAQLLTGFSFPELGRRFGNRDHTTVLHAARKVAKMRDADEQVKAMLVELEGHFTAQRPVIRENDLPLPIPNNIKRIIEEVGEFYSIPDIFSVRGSKGAFLQRRIVCYLCRTQTANYLKDIAHYLDLDYTTVFKAQAKIARYRELDRELHDELTWLEGKLA